MKISIAVCTYNGAKFLTEQLESFLRQTLLPDELVVCDDRSSDETVEMIRDFALDAPFPVHIHVNEENLGSTKNFEKAISLCQGDLIFLADQDDVWHEKKLEKFVAAFNSDERIGLVFCDGDLVDEHLNVMGVSAWETRRFDVKRQNRMEKGGGLAMLLQSNVVTGCMMAFRAEYRRLFLPIPDDIHEVIHDYWITIVIAATARVKLIPEKLVKYRQHSGQQLGLSAGNAVPDGIGERAVNKVDFYEPLSKLEDLQRYFEEFKKNAEKHEINNLGILDEIDLQKKHFQTRVMIGESRKQRLRLVAKELFSRRYHQYSSGWLSVMKDLSLYFSK